MNPSREPRDGLPSGVRQVIRNGTLKTTVQPPYHWNPLPERTWTLPGINQSLQTINELRFDQDLLNRSHISLSPYTQLPLYLCQGSSGYSVDVEDTVLDGMTKEWLAEPEIPKLLFGGEEIRPFEDNFLLDPQITRLPLPTDDIPNQPASAYLRYQQLYSIGPDLPPVPVLGGALTVRLDGLRIAATSTFTPIPPDIEFTRRISEDEAMGRGWDILQAYMRATQQPLVAQSDVPSYATVVYHQTAGGSSLAILAYQHSYHLVYEVHIPYPDANGRTWAVFIDAATGEGVALPQVLTYDIRVFGSSSDALQVNSANASLTYEEQLTSPDFTDFCRFFPVALKDNTTLITESDWQGLEASQPALDSDEFALCSVAAHAYRFYTYLNRLSGGALRTKLLDTEQQDGQDGPITLLTQVGDGSTNDLLTYFDPAKRQVQFQKDHGQGLTINKDWRKLYQPALDPELIYHEMAHALMWRLNPDPFKTYQNLVQGPFARALVEGYATYFAHSCGARFATSPRPYWALATYRDDEWCDHWALRRKRVVDGADCFLLPNLYPIALATSRDTHIAYDVGMIWARALWDLREIVGADEADRIALQAYLALQGLITSFEVVAEAAIQDVANSDQRAQVIVGFNTRRILAEQGVQALVAKGQQAWIGLDTGLWHSSDGGLNWGLTQPLELLPTVDPQDLKNVVALAFSHAEEGVCYAAVEQPLVAERASSAHAVFRRVPNDNLWRPFGSWPDTVRPLTMFLGADDYLYVGTPFGIWRLAEGAAPDAPWEKVAEDGPRLPLCMGLVKEPMRQQPAVGGIESPLSYKLCVAAYDTIFVKLEAEEQWLTPTLDKAQTDLVISLITHEELLFVGTGNIGIWQCRLGDDSAAPSLTRDQIASPDDLNHQAVHCLFYREIANVPHLYAGTRGAVVCGVKRGADWQWHTLSSPPASQNEIVTCLAVSQTHLLAGTTSGSLWSLPLATLDGMLNVQRGFGQQPLERSSVIFRQ